MSPIWLFVALRFRLCLFIALQLRLLRRCPMSTCLFLFDFTYTCSVRSHTSPFSVGSNINIREIACSEEFRVKIRKIEGRLSLFFRCYRFPAANRLFGRQKLRYRMVDGRCQKITITTGNFWWLIEGFRWFAGDTLAVVPLVIPLAMTVVKLSVPYRRDVSFCFLLKQGENLDQSLKLTSPSPSKDKRL
ncbi:hypothetical protein MA16_Dca001922 [Dendrobium catenatum]|uniref:Secreted protein n=1 Tax=Dendrobium catenatum TaxID=906689 RepID=A0A2I0XDU4_9ASPA|nr:hypothetical protein MA16_Dca001922 [Dendrobium catenatum]